VKQRKPNVFADTHDNLKVAIARDLERLYASFVAEPVPQYLQAFVDRLADTAGHEPMSQVPEHEPNDILGRIHNMARCGLYRDCAAIEQELRNTLQYPLVREWFADPLFCQQINELCETARRNLSVDRT
jgi:hypothetical protein